MNSTTTSETSRLNYDPELNTNEVPEPPEDITAAFEEMRERGILTIMGGACCGGCSSSAAGIELGRMDVADEAEGVIGYAYYHEQDVVKEQRVTNRDRFGGVTEEWEPVGDFFSFYIGYGAGRYYDGEAEETRELPDAEDDETVAKHIVECLENAGLTVEWNGDAGTRVKVER